MITTFDTKQCSLQHDQKIIDRPSYNQHVCEESSDIILDCNELENIDSAGLEALIWLLDELKQRGCKLRLTCLRETVIRTFEIRYDHA